jgi:hypothetical protein
MCFEGMRNRLKEEEKSFSYGTISDTLENLAKMGFLKTPPLSVYGTKYEFPNESIIDSIFNPIEKAISEISKARLIAVKQAKKMEFLMHPQPFKSVTREGFYIECGRLHDLSDEIMIFANTPGIILITENRDPSNPIRGWYFENLKRRLEEGLRVKYLFNWDATKEIIKSWVKDGLEENIKESKKLCTSENGFLNNPEIKTLEVKAVRNTSLPGMVIGEKTVVVGVKDRRAIDSEHAIRGEVINEETLVNHFRNAFEIEWERGEEIDKTVIDKILAEIEGEE